MRKSRKASCRTRDGEEAMDRIMEAGELLAALVGPNADQTVTFAHMDLQIEAIEIGYELIDHEKPQRVREWLIPKRDILMNELKQRGLDKSEDAQFAFRKLEAVLRWVDSWENKN